MSSRWLLQLANLCLYQGVLGWFRQEVNRVAPIRLETITALISDFEHGMVRQCGVLALLQFSLNLIFYSFDQFATVLILHVVF